MPPPLLDTHVLLWWYLDAPDLTPEMAQKIQSEELKEGLAVSIISLWEIAKLAEIGRIRPEFSLDEWFGELEEDPGIWMIPLSARIVIESSRLGPHFHKDPADQLIVATARCHGLRVLTVDERIHRSGIVALA
ncbi:MAG: type II toxin-antitoxin system VapC family toxin [Deltaproteobacteria bacterium]|nr:type II toxin-antitoxin system VapC family toxin [Deltaproteobacteria bacterium]